MLELLVVALFQMAAGEPAAPVDGSLGAAPVEQTEPIAPVTPIIPEVVAPATEAPAATPAPAAEPRTERVCRYERAGGASRTSRALVCRDVVIRDEAAEDNDAS
jgi:hypothetical protein